MQTAIGIVVRVDRPSSGDQIIRPMVRDGDPSIEWLRGCAGHPRSPGIRSSVDRDVAIDSCELVHG